MNQINTAAARRAGLEISARLLQLALPEGAGREAVHADRLVEALERERPQRLHRGAILHLGVGVLGEEYLARISNEGHLAIDDPGDAFGVFYGLVVQDTQIRVLLGEPPPSKAALAAHAASAVDRFFVLFVEGR